MTDTVFDMSLRQMVEIISMHAYYARELLGKPVLDERVIDIMGRTPRHEFVPVELSSFAYLDQPLPIGYDKTISQPFIVALMTDLLDLAPTDVVLEVGTGLGYHTAVLSQLAARVYSTEIVEELAVEARKRLDALGYRNVVLRTGSGENGWFAHAPYDKILVCAAPELIPVPLLNQMKPGGKMVLPVGLAEAQKLMLVEKTMEGRIRTRDILPVRFAILETAD